ncbi:hypothetical protein TCDM_10889 [Trypanosoma cruzi Dm28c]|uniref:Uncharacterized protein n=1 Tax=Trypanosoma cruzi Dm28c TaxID=1416333 RepID=V5D251_TRYCR|nr:hypothetical protein TCDM_10889 [Trypanosoma cruzi Dm28c]
MLAEQLCATKKSKEGTNGRERQIAHTQITHIITHTHTQPRNGCTQPQNQKENKTKSRSVGLPAHTHSHYPRKATHTQKWREREKGRPLNAIKTKQKQLRCSAHAARQDGSGACRAKESTNGPAWVCMHIYNGHIIVCASWGEVRARVHARGHTEREKEVCVRAVRGSLTLTLTRPPPQQQPHTQQEEEAKEGRWCGRPRCCCHCRPYLRLHL